MNFHIITLFPDLIKPYTDGSMLGRAQKEKKIKVDYYNPRDYTNDRLKRIDDKPYGGGPGMVMEAEPVLRAAEKAIGRKKDVEVIFFSPSGKQFDQAMAKELTKKKHVVMLSGHYEGIDQRAVDILGAIPVSVGPYVLTGGELPAAIIVDAVSRHIPGVLGNIDSIEEERNASPETYTRPEVLTWKRKKYSVPEVLLSGHHKKIEEWRASRKRKKK